MIKPCEITLCRAKDGMKIFLVFGTSHNSQSTSSPATVVLDGEGFDIPEGTYMKYVTKGHLECHSTMKKCRLQSLSPLEHSLVLPSSMLILT